MIDDAIDGLDGWNMDEDIEDHIARHRTNTEKYTDSTDEEENEDDEEHSNSSSNSDDEGGDLTRSSSPNLGSKPRHVQDADDDEHFRKAVKVQASVGRPKAADYELSVRAILSVAFSLFRGRLITQGPYPDAMLENVWAKQSWNEACKQLSTNILFNSELLRMVGFLFTHLGLYLLCCWVQITARGSHLRGEIKMKICPYLTSEYGFETSNKLSVINKNINLYRKLKDDYSFYFKVRLRSTRVTYESC